MLLVTVALAYVASVCAGFFSYFTGVTFFPSLIEVDSYIAASEAAVTSIRFSPSRWRHS